MPHEIRNIQSPYTESDFWNNFTSVTPRMGIFIKITSKAEFGSVVRGFTSNSRNMTLPGHPGVTFRPSSAITPTQLETSIGEAPSMELTGAYESNGITHEEAYGGKWNFAAIEVFSACWDNVNLGELLDFSGNMGVLKDYQTYFTAEARGKISRLSNDVTAQTSRLCRAPEFGDAVYCKKDLSGTVTVNSVAYNITQTGKTGSPGSTIGELNFDTSLFTGTVPTEPNFDDYMLRFSNGKLTATSGPNAGVSREIAGAYEPTGGFPFMAIVVKRAWPFEITGGTTFTLKMGCNHTQEDCMIYGNILNRRAEDYIPGIESITRLPTVG